MVAEIVEVKVVLLRPRLLKVEHPRGYQLVAGGRLLLECVDGRKTPHPEMPPYMPEMFPTDYADWAWADNLSHATKVWFVGRKKNRQIGSVRASTLLFAPLPVDVVTDWLRGCGR